MNDAQREKLKTLPNEPGVYFHRDEHHKIIYIGKAANLKNRVMSYSNQVSTAIPRRDFWSQIFTKPTG